MLKTFYLDETFDSIEDLSDGVCLSKALRKIAPNYFDETWLSKIKTDSDMNWRVKTSNLKKISKGITDYYAEVLGQQILDFQMPDVAAIGERNDATEMGRLLQLVLGCAVNCADKQEYIQGIMSMEEQVQHMVMQAIQELMTKEVTAKDEAESGLVEQLKKTVEELNTVMAEKDDLAQRCHELDLQIAALHEENFSLELDNEKLNERVHQADSLDDPSDFDDWLERNMSTPAGRRFQQLQSQVEQQQEEIFRLESEKEDFRIKAELKEKEMLDLHQKNDELIALAKEARSLKDENDVLRHTADKVSKYEATLETLKKKLDGKSDLDGQLKILEDKNTTLIQTNMEMEEEVRRLAALRPQVDLYKRQVQELQSKCADETKRADKAEFEAKRNSDKMSTVQREKEKLKEENVSLCETIDELQGRKAQQDNLQSDGNLDDSYLVGLTLPPEVKERLIRLEHENKKLRMRGDSQEEEGSAVLQSLLDDSTVRNNELQTEVRILNQRILELEAQIEDFQESKAQSASDTAAPSASAQMLNQTLNEQLSKNRQLSEQLQLRQATLDELEPNLAAREERIRHLEAVVGEKDKEMRAMEERYKRYLEKAKAVVQSLNPRKSTSTEPEMLLLRNQLQERDRLIEHLEKELEKTKNIKEQEEKLIVTAWYNLGRNMQRYAAEQRILNGAGGQTLLARQRQAQTRRAGVGGAQGAARAGPQLQGHHHLPTMAGSR